MQKHIASHTQNRADQQPSTRHPAPPPSTQPPGPPPTSNRLQVADSGRFLCQADEKLELTLSVLQVPWMLNMDCRDVCQDGVMEDHAAMEMEICLGPQ